MVGDPPLSSLPLPRLTYPRVALGLCSLAWFAVTGGRMILPALAVPIKQSLSIDNSGFGLAVTIMWLCYALLQFPGGLASDELGYRSTLLSSTLVVSVGFLLVAISGTMLSLMLALGIVGAGVGLFFVASRTLPSMLYGDQKGRALGISNAAGDLGGVMAPLVASVIIAHSWPWRGIFLLVASSLLVLAVLFHRFLRGAYHLEMPDVRSAASDAATQISGPRITTVISVYGVFALTFQGTMAFLPLYLFESKGLSLAMANLLLATFFLMGVIVKPVSGWISERVNRNLLAAVSLTTAGVTLAILALFLSQRVSIAVAIVVFGGSLMVFPPVAQSFLISSFADETVGSSFGLTRSVYMLIGSAGPFLVGIGSNWIGFDITFLVIAVGLSISGGILGVTNRIS